jgi:membrane protein
VRIKTGLNVARKTAAGSTNTYLNVKPKPLNFKTIYSLLKDTVCSCISRDTISQGAALSYYTFFAITPLFIIVLGLAGFWFGEAAAQRELFGQLNQLVGKQGGDAIQALVVAANKSRTGFWATCIAGGTLAVAATGVFVQLQNSLNILWQVRHPNGRKIRSFIRHRLLSFAMVLGIGFLLLVSLVCSAGLAALGNVLGDYVSGKDILLKALNFAISLGIITVLFTMIFKFLPDVKIAWRDVWLGGFITALLFNLGKILIGAYIGRSSLSSVYGAVGSLAIVLVWVYYSAQILFFGAQFTALYASRFGVKPEPVGGAEFIPISAAEIKPPLKSAAKR